MLSSTMGLSSVTRNGFACRKCNILIWGLGMLKASAVVDRPSTEHWDLAELYEQLLISGHLAGYQMTSRFYEIGSLEGLAETNRLLLTSRLKRLRLAREVGSADTLLHGGHVPRWLADG
jgi:NDP-sugar pyrophosphorylase family protein